MHGNGRLVYCVRCVGRAISRASIRAGTLLAGPRLRMEDTMPIAEWVKAISGLGTFASVAVAIVVFMWTKRKERLDRTAAVPHVWESPGRPVAGWDTYLKGWCPRENFRRLWRELRYEFDKGFMDYIGRQTGRLTS